MKNYESIDFKRIIEIVISKIVIVIAIITLCILAGYFYSYSYKVPKYSSSVTILLTGDESESEVTQTDLSLNSGLISTYTNIVTSTNVLEKTIQNLGLNISVQELQNNVKASQVGSTQFLKISVTNTNAEQACNIANELAKVFTEQIKEIYNLENINIVDSAEIANKPYNINHKKDLLIFGVFGIAISTVLVMAIYLFDDTVKNEKDIEENLRLKNLGTLPIDKDKETLITDSNPKSHIVECIKTLRTNILFSINKNAILFTSYNEQEGKSWVINNLAVAISQANKKVILVDANLRVESEKVNIFNINKDEGLSDFIKEITDDKLTNLKKAKRYIKETNIPNLHILQSGTTPPNPTALVSSEKMEKLLDLLKTMYDVVLIDGVAVNKVSDSIAISSMVDSTIIVAEDNKTKLSDLRKVKRAIEDVEGNILGVILNKSKVKKGKYYGKKYGYGYYYGHQDGKIEKIEEKQKDITLDDIIKIAKENIKYELEHKVEEVEKIEINEDSDDLAYQESLKLQSEIKDFRTEVKDEMKKMKNIVIKNENNSKFEELNNKVESINYDNKFKELNEKVESINYDNKFEELNEKVESINYDNKFEELNEKVESINYDNKFEELNEKVESINYDNKFEELNEKVESINYDNKFEELNNKVESINYDNKFEELNEKINSINYEENIKEIIQSFIDEVNSLNEEIKNIKQQQENNNSELIGKMDSIEMAGIEQKLELLGQINQLEENRKNQKLELIEKMNRLETDRKEELNKLELDRTEQINKFEEERKEERKELLEGISKIEENIIKQNSEIIEKLEKIETNNKTEQLNTVKASKEEKINNIISFEELKERNKRLKSRVFSINEPIAYEDLEALSPYVIDLNEAPRTNLALSE